MNRKGNTLVSALVGIGIAGILMAVFASMTSNQLKMHTHLSEKFEVLDLERNLLATLSDPSVCLCQFTPDTANISAPGNKFFNATVWDNPATAADESDFITVSKINAGCVLGSPVLAQQNQYLTNGSNIIVDSIKLKNLRPENPTLPANQRIFWQGIWEISFKQNLGKIALAPLKISQRFQVSTMASSPESSRRIISCTTATKSLKCVTGYYLGSLSQSDIVYTQGYSPSNFSEVFRIYNSGPMEWGLGCQPSWLLQSCTISTNAAGDSDLAVRSSGYCVSDQEEWAQNAMIFTTCCKLD